MTAVCCDDTVARLLCQPCCLRKSTLASKSIKMVKEAVASFAAFVHDVVDFLPPMLLPILATGFICDRKYIKSFFQELVGSIIMICFTFSAGKWIGSESVRTAWTSHFFGVIAADYVGQGPMVNPAMSIAFWCLGKISYTEMYVRIAGQMGGGLIAFPLFHALSNYLKLQPFGGPECNMDADHHSNAEAFLSEFEATFLLVLVVYAVNLEMNFGTYHYWIKQSLTAIAIRALIEVRSLAFFDNLFCHNGIIYPCTLVLFCSSSQPQVLQ